MSPPDQQIHAKISGPIVMIIMDIFARRRAAAVAARSQRDLSLVVR